MSDKLLFGLPDEMMQADPEGSTLICALMSESLERQGKTGRWTLDPDMLVYRPRQSADFYLYARNLDTGERVAVILQHDPYEREEEGPHKKARFIRKRGEA